MSRPLLITLAILTVLTVLALALPEVFADDPGAFKDGRLPPASGLR